MKPENKAMSRFLAQKGIKNVTAKYISTGSLRGCWRLYVRAKQPDKLFETWTEKDADNLNSLGFTDFDGKPLGRFSGNGGMWQVFVRGHNELIEESKPC